MELHVDGSAFAATPVAFNTANDSSGRDVGELTLVDDGILVVDLVLRWCAHQIGAWGTATVVFGLSDDAVAPARAIELVFAEGSGVRQRRGTRRVADTVVATTVADLANVATLQQRLSVAHGALSGLLQWFGVAEPPQLQRDGTIVPQQFTMSHYRQVERWAADHGVLVQLLPSR